MTVEQLVQMQRAEPFQAYRIHLADGRHLDLELEDITEALRYAASLAEDRVIPLSQTGA